VRKNILLFSFFTTFLFSFELVTPIPLHVEYNKQKALLGKKLFHDVRLSKDDTISCASCHDLNKGGVDGLEVSRGVAGKLGTVNSPTVFNTLFNISQFWDGRAKDLKSQVLGPIHNPVEMGMQEGEVSKKIAKIKEYRDLFFRIYDDGVSIENITDAIAEFEKALITPNSRFDKYLRGDSKVLTQDEQEGFELFKSLGCISCHNGVLLGGNFYQKIGIYEKYDTDENLGRYHVTKNDDDKYYFKVPMLRNISQTKPYLHNGEIFSLQQVIQIMAHYQLGQDLDKKTKELIFKFLLTLDGERPSILDEK
jgi:cytochrome c peroxidase